MNIPISQFEQYINETILKRGLSYFKNGHVKEPEEITAGIYEAIVEGSEDYRVEFTVENEIIVEHECSCPYDAGPVCKHMAAILFYLQRDVLDIGRQVITVNKVKEKSSSKNTKKKSVTEQINDILEIISHEELKQFIRDKSKDNPPFRNIFLYSFAHINADESKELYAQQIKYILKTAAGRDGFIYWNQAHGVRKAVNELLTAAQRQFENKNFSSCIFICSAVMEEMADALEFADDSNGDISEGIDFSYQLLRNLSQENLSEDVRKLLFEYCLSSFESRRYYGYDWHLGILDLAGEILKNEDEAQRIIAYLDQIQYSEYAKHDAQKIKLTIIKKTKGDAEADKFIEQNITNPDFRRKAIATAIENKEFNKATDLAKDGIKHDEKDKPGLVSEWYQWLLEIAQQQNDKEQIIANARFLFIDHRRSEKDYYQILKDHVDTHKWNTFLEDIIKDIMQKKGWPDFDLIAKIYIREEAWNKLMKLVKERPSLTYIEQYETYLSADFSDTLIKLYGEGVVWYLKNNIGRSHYQTACKYLRRMIKLGGKASAEIIIADFRKQYAQRRALMDELKKI